MLCFTDTETRSTVDLRTGGTDRYFTEAEPLLLQMAIDNGPVRLWDIIHGEPEPPWFLEVVNDPSAIFIAGNYSFDRTFFERLLFQHPTRMDQWRCTRAQAYAHGLPGGLAGQCRALGVPLNLSKIADGKRLIQKFCVPIPKSNGEFREPEGSDWDDFKAYAIMDVIALRQVWQALPTHNYRGTDLEYFWLDGRINERGFAVDFPLI